MKYSSYLKKTGRLINLKSWCLNFQEFTMNIDNMIRKLEQEDCVK